MSNTLMHIPTEATERVSLLIQDDKLSLMVMLGSCMLACAIWGAALVIAKAIREHP